MEEYHDSIPADIIYYPTVPVRDVVIFPHTAVRFKIGRQTSVNAMVQALRRDKIIFLVTQRDAIVEEPTFDQVYSIGTLARISHHIQLVDGNIKVQFEGIERGSALRFEEHPDGYWVAAIRRFHQKIQLDPQINSLIEKLMLLIDQYRQQNTTNLDGIPFNLHTTNPSKLIDSIANHLKITIVEKQKILELFSIPDRLMYLIELVEIELEKLQMDRTLNGRVRKQMDKVHKEFYLTEKIKAINKELGHKDDKTEIEELRKKIEDAGMTEEAYNKATSELKRIEQMLPISPEVSISRSYLDWLLSIPWKQFSEDVNDLKLAEDILERDHYGLEKVKERILEFLAVRQLVSNPKGSILCFLGPPGVGKTSLGRSIAKAIGRKFVRLSLGGVRDEAEIRGHRRTYIGSLPGQIIQMMKKAGTINPVILLDEVDKLSTDFRGDPSSALLEVLDPEQNNLFRDHYLDVEYDLSKVVFIATANVIHPIPLPLQDRFEVIRISGYTEKEKLEIAKRYLIPKQLEATGFKSEQIEFLESSVMKIVQNYTREAGVRSLERDISSICRKIARKFVMLEDREHFKTIVDGDSVPNYLGPIRFQPQIAEGESEVGLSTGLAWTEVGGEVLHIETTLVPGRGQIILTGKLGEVMQESARTAITYVRSRATQLGLSPNFYKRYDVHIHIPEGAIPKDGPSAGITMVTSIVSALTGVPVNKNVAMTGEITLRGKVLPIGGLKEKLLAAHRAGFSIVICPKDNQKDLVEVSKEILDELTVYSVDNMDQVLRLALDETLIKESIDQISPIWNTDIVDKGQILSHSIK